MDVNEHLSFVGGEERGKAAIERLNTPLALSSVKTNEGKYEEIKKEITVGTPAQSKRPLEKIKLNQQQLF